MRDNAKSKAELLQEVETLCKRVTELEQCKDIAGHKKDEEEIRASEERFRELAARSFDLIFMTDAQGYLTYISAASEKIFHYKPEEMVGTHFKNYLIKSEIPRVSQRFAENMQGKNLGNFRMEAMRKDGSHIFIELNSSPIVKNGETIGIQGIIRDITERKRAEGVLRESEKRFREIFENIAVGVYRTTPDGQILIANPALVHMLEYSSFEELSERNLEEKGFEPQYERSTFKEEIEREGWIVSSESTWITRDGKKLHVIENARAVRDEDGKTLYYEGTAENITERKNTEQSLQESEERLRVALSAAQMGTWRWDPATNQDTRDASFNGILRLEAVESTQPVEDFLQRVHPEDRDMVDAEIQRSLREHCTYVAEFRIVRPDGTVRWLRDQGKPLYDEDDHILYMTGAVVDITERKKAEEKLKQYRFMVESAHDVIFFKDVESRYIIANNKTLEAFGLSREQVIGRNDYEIMPDKAEATKNIEDDKLVFETGKPTEITKHMTGSDGKEHWFQAIKVPQFDDKGNIIGLIGIARDITESKRRETELNLYREKMSHAERLASLGTLSATLAHRLTQPLTAIRLSIENTLADLETTSGLDTIIEDLKDGLSAVSDVVSTIDIFRDFARKSSVEIVSEVSLKAVAERIVRLLSESARQARVSLQLKGMDKLPPILSNEKDLEQLFFALVENAIQAADGKKSRRLIVSGDVKDEHIELQFADNCGGIAAENLDKIFEPFFTTRPARERTGLGLCIVEHIVSGAGGKIRLESKAGKGSTFFVTLPISRDRMS
ncbi:MAG TPA: PAS domain S-box protein [Planctomycetes bacterium]|nr:PAS domain S-box protein [Planctomycetota bacterium]